SSIAFSEAENVVVATDPSGAESGRFAPERVPEFLEIIREPWTYLPFVHERAKSWEGPVSARTEGLFFVGPLARLNRCRPFDTPLAEEERQRLVSFLGPPPLFNAIAGYWSMIVELIGSAEEAENLFSQESLSGAEIRVVGTDPGRSGLAAFEAPEGFVFHRYEVDERGLVEEVTILDAASQNNSLRSILTQKASEEAMAREESWEEAKNSMERSLVPF
ncbi:MAG: hypothetical protein ACP5SH_10120, partial [Syntrophobacteraceae bacterium]